MVARIKSTRCTCIRHLNRFSRISSPIEPTIVAFHSLRRNHRKCPAYLLEPSKERIRLCAQRTQQWLPPWQRPLHTRCLPFPCRLSLEFDHLPSRKEPQVQTHYHSLVDRREMDWFGLMVDGRIPNLVQVSTSKRLFRNNWRRHYNMKSMV